MGKKVETNTPGKLKMKPKKKGGKGGFTDIMDELAHTLGRLRGEILDETPEKELKAISEAPIGSENDVLAESPGDDEKRRRKKSFTLGVQRLVLGNTDDSEERRHTSSGGGADIPGMTEEMPKGQFDKYVKMQKNKLPEGAIRQRMEMDGLSARDI